MPRLDVRLILTLIVLGGTCAVYCGKELRYIAWGTPADARIMNMVQIAGRRPSELKMRVTYQFNDGAKSRTESDDVSFDYRLGTTTVPIEYISGSSSSRLRGNGHRPLLWVTAGVLAIGLGVVSFRLATRRTGGGTKPPPHVTGH